MSSSIAVSEPQQANLAWTFDLNDLRGKLLTIVDASFADQQQRKAVKDLVSQTLWQWVGQLPELRSHGRESQDFTIVRRDRLGNEYESTKETDAKAQSSDSNLN